MCQTVIPLATASTYIKQPKVIHKVIHRLSDNCPAISARPSALLNGQQLRQPRKQLLSRNQRVVPITSTPIFQLTGAQVALADHHPMRDTDQLHIGEHNARPNVAIIQQNLDPGVQQFPIERFGGLADGGRPAGANRQQRYLKRRHRGGPNDAALIVVLLDGGCHPRWRLPPPATRRYRSNPW